MKLPILHIGHPLLRQPSQVLSIEQLVEPVTQVLIDNMIETMRAAGGVGLAAVQVGEALRICVLEVATNGAANKRYPYMPTLDLRVLVNPILTSLPGEQGIETAVNYEGCLSVPGLRGAVERPLVLQVQAWDRFGNRAKVIYSGLAAVIVSHECDHLDGILFPDRADPQTLCTWEMYEQFHQAAEVEKWARIQARTPVSEQVLNVDHSID